MTFLQRWKYTLAVRAFGWWKIPLIGFLKPKIHKLNTQEIEISIPLNWRTKNHLRSMYFGALSTGADIACGLLAFKLIYEKYPNIQMVFKDFDAKFLKRAESEVFFCCKNGPEIVRIMEEAQETGEMCEIKTQVVAVTRKNN